MSGEKKLPTKKKKKKIIKMILFRIKYVFGPLTFSEN